MDDLEDITMLADQVEFRLDGYDLLTPRVIAAVAELRRALAEELPCRRRAQRRPSSQHPVH